MSDSSRRTRLTGLSVSDRKKILRPRDYARSHRVDGTFGLEVIRAVLAADDTVIVPPDELELDGFEVDKFTSRRFPHLQLTRPGGRAWTAAPKSGRFTSAS